MENAKIRVIIKEPGRAPRSVNVSPSLENLQKHVGGYLEYVRVSKNMVILCNEEGLLQQLPYNCTVGNIPFVGTIILIGTRDGEFCDLPIPFAAAKKVFAQMWEA